MSAFRADLKQFNLDEAAGKVIAIADIMFDAGFTEIASTGGQAVDNSPGAGFNRQVTVEQRHDNIVMLVPVPSGAVPELRKISSCHALSLILDLHGANGAVPFPAFTHGVSLLRLNFLHPGRQSPCKARHYVSAGLYCRQRKG